MQLFPDRIHIQNLYVSWVNFKGLTVASPTGSYVSFFLVGWQTLSKQHLAKVLKHKRDFLENTCEMRESL